MNTQHPTSATFSYHSAPHPPGFCPQVSGLIPPPSDSSPRSSPLSPRAGLTLAELLISILLVSIIMSGMYAAIGTVFTAHDQTTRGQDELAHARYALDHMTMFIEETDDIVKPATTSVVERLELTDCVLDTYTNATYRFAAGGDGFLDADNDANGLVNDSAALDPADLVHFYLDKTDSANWLLMMERPNYTTADFHDRAVARMLCEHVTEFKCAYLGNGTVELSLTVLRSAEALTLMTRAKSRRMDRR